MRHPSSHLYSLVSPLVRPLVQARHLKARYERFMAFATLTLSLVSLSLGCGEIEELKTQERYPMETFEAEISPMLTSMGCGTCHAQPQGGFKWDASGTPEALNDNLLYTQRFMNRDEPAQSPLLLALLPTQRLPAHQALCPQDCNYQALLAWGSDPSLVEQIRAQACEAPRPLPHGNVCGEVSSAAPQP
jgi:hypothetical protein